MRCDTSAIPPLVVLADDVTGAADTAARLFAAGLPASIVLEGRLPDSVAALTSDSRHLEPGPAAERVRATLRAADAPPGAVWYKKIDSTLRGNIAAELDALLDALRLPYAVVCAAFPGQGRGTLGGRLVAPDLRGAAPSLPELLGASPRPVALVHLDEVRAGWEPLAIRLTALVAGGARLLALDALSDADLETVERATSVALPDALRCGSAGLAGALARRLAGAQTTGAEPRSAPRADGPALLVIGSGSPAARRQLDALLASGEIRALTIEARGSSRPGPAWDDLASSGCDLALHLPPPDGTAALDGPEARLLAERLADAGAALAERMDPALVVLAGGDTAGAMLRRLGVRRLDVRAELLPGMPLAEAVDGAGRGRLFALKAGAHGGDEALLELLRLARGV
jgi:uncharacterized protein YgbK (DUF1537 family)